MPKATEETEPKPEGKSEGEEQQQEGPASFDEFLNAQPDPVKVLYQEHVKGLQNTVKATRDERDALAKELREAAKQVEKGSKLEGQLNDMAGKLDEANMRAAFYERAPEMECRNPKAAYAIMVAQDLRTRSGDPDWKAIRAALPEVFGKAQMNANAGSGTQDGHSLSPNALMNEIIRGKGRT